MRRRVIQCTIGVFVVAVFAFVAAAIATLNRVDDAYAQWDAADMLINYMDDHDGEWPKKWGDLKPYFDKKGGWDFRQFTNLVWIDFTVNADDLRAASASSDKIPFNVVGSTSIFALCFDDGPNGQLHRYFNPNAPHPSPPTTAIIEVAAPNEGG